MNLILLTIGFLLLIYGITCLAKENKGEKTSGFKGQLDSAIESTDDFKLEIGRLRNEFSETLVELQTEIYDLKNSLEVENRVVSYEKKDEFIQSSKKRQKKEGISTEFSENDIVEEKKESSITSKQQSKSNSIVIIKKLLNEGKSIDEICKATKMNKGEILLVKELYL